MMSISQKKTKAYLSKSFRASPQLVAEVRSELELAGFEVIEQRSGWYPSLLKDCEVAFFVVPNSPFNKSQDTSCKIGKGQSGELDIFISNVLPKLNPNSKKSNNRRLFFISKFDDIGNLRYFSGSVALHMDYQEKWTGIETTRSKSFKNPKSVISLLQPETTKPTLSHFEKEEKQNNFEILLLKR